MKTVIGIMVGIVAVFSVVAMYCAMVVAGRSDDNENNSDNNKGDNCEMFLKKQICPRCKTGKYTYDLDPKSETCPYIGCWRRNKCSFYKPLDKESKKGVFSGFKNKRSVVTPPPKNRPFQAVLQGFEGGCVTQVK